MIVINEPTCVLVLSAIRAETNIVRIARAARGTIQRLKSRVEINRLLDDTELNSLGEALLESLAKSCALEDLHAYQQLRLVDGRDHNILIIDFLFKLPEEGSNAA